jgi:hypothetical protein
MRKIIEQTEGEVLEKFLGEKILVMCANYFYNGALKGINETCILLSNASIVYETGEWSASNFKDVQQLPSEWYVQLSAIESFGAGK